MALIDNLISYYRLDETSGTVLDAHGSNDGTNNGATPNQTSLASGNVGTAYDFESSESDYIDMGDFTISTDKLSLSAWIKLETASINHWIIGKDDNTLGREFAFGISNTNHLTTQIAGVGSSSQGSATLTTGTWYHIAVVFNSTTNNGEYFLDGVSDGTFTSTGNLSNTTATFNIGRRSFSGAEENTDGLIDEVGVWNEVKTASDFLELTNSGNGLAYPFTTGTGVQINISDVWKEVSAMKINIGDSWKEVVGAQINIGDSWKTIF